MVRVRLLRVVYTLPNKSVKWALSTEFNIGLDLGIINDRISGSVDFYIKKTKGALMNGVFPSESGASRFIQNFADVTNKGVEFEMSAQILKTEVFSWDISFNIAKNISTLDAFDEEFVKNNNFLKQYYEIGKENLSLFVGMWWKRYFRRRRKLTI